MLAVSILITLSCSSYNEQTFIRNFFPWWEFYKYSTVKLVCGFTSLFKCLLHPGFPRVLTNLRPVFILIFQCGECHTKCVIQIFVFCICILYTNILYIDFVIQSPDVGFWCLMEGMFHFYFEAHTVKLFSGFPGTMSIVFFSFPFPEAAALPQTWFYLEFILFKKNVLLHTSTEYHSHWNCLYGCHSHCALFPLS